MNEKLTILDRVGLAMFLGLGTGLTQTPSPAGAADTLLPPSVVQCRTDCDADTVTVVFNKPVQLDGDYFLENPAFVWSRGYGTNTAEVVLYTSPLSAGRSYGLTISGVHDLDSPTNVLAPQTTVWSIACPSSCGPLTSRPGPGGSVIVEWNPSAAALEASTDLLVWSNVVNATSPRFVTPFPQRAQFYRLRCADGTGPEPAIIQEPNSIAVSAGTTVRLSAAATGAGLSFQWLFNGTNLAGATDSILRLAGVSSAQVGVYQLRATNTFGAVTSAPACLVLNNNTEGVPFNTTKAEPAVAALLLSSQNLSGLPLNTTMAEPPMRVLLLNSTSPPDFPLNTTVAQPPTQVLLINSTKPPDFPLNTTVAQPTVTTLLLSRIPSDFSLNTMVANPPARVLLINSTNPPDFPLNSGVAQPPSTTLLLSGIPSYFPFNTTLAQPPISILVGTNQSPR